MNPKLHIGIALALFCVVGCGGTSNLPDDMGAVTGTVTMDGEPLANALVTFECIGRRPSYATTNADGEYDLVYTDGNHGAVIGMHSVSITKADNADAEALGGGEYGGGGEEAGRGLQTIPADYNVRSTLSAEVVAGQNTFDFPLVSGGEIVQETY